MQLCICQDRKAIVGQMNVSFVVAGQSHSRNECSTYWWQVLAGNKHWQILLFVPVSAAALKLVRNSVIGKVCLAAVQVRSVCEAMPHTGCELCLPSWEKNQTWGDCDLLDVYGSVCSEMPGKDMIPFVLLQHMCCYPYLQT